MTKDRLRRYWDMNRERQQLENQLQGVSVTLSLLRPYAPRERLECIGQRVSDILQTKVDRSDGGSGNRAGCSGQYGAPDTSYPRHRRPEVG